jgi:PAS domain S-box-containing protein
VSLLKAIKAASSHVQVILMTGEPTIETASVAAREGACDYLAKPIGKEQLLRTVANAARIKKLDDQRRRLEKENRLYRENLAQLVEERTAALRESEARYRAVTEDTPVLICRFQPDGELTFVNPAYCKYFEKTSEELVGSSFLAHVPAVDQETVLANIQYQGAYVRFADANARVRGHRAERRDTPSALDESRDV